MSVLELRDIPGARPEGLVDGLDKYLREKGSEHIAAIARFTVSPEEVVIATTKAREELLRDQPTDIRAAFLVQQLTEALKTSILKER